ncbi:MAG: hypothetical protein WDN06_04725 [Asticcacaulis sp.]
MTQVMLRLGRPRHRRAGCPTSTAKDEIGGMAGALKVFKEKLLEGEQLRNAQAALEVDMPEEAEGRGRATGQRFRARGRRHRHGRVTCRGGTAIFGPDPVGGG